MKMREARGEGEKRKNLVFIFHRPPELYRIMQKRTEPSIAILVHVTDLMSPRVTLQPSTAFRRLLDFSRALNCSGTAASGHIQLKTAMILGT